MSLLNGRFFVKTGDITLINTDIIVNAANASLLGGCGVDAAIHKAACQNLLKECRRIRKETLPQGLATGNAVLTGAGKLPCRFVISTGVYSYTSNAAAAVVHRVLSKFTHTLSLPEKIILLFFSQRGMDSFLNNIPSEGE